MKQKTFYISVVTLVLGLFLGFVWGQATQVAEPADVQDGAFSLMLDFGDGDIVTYPDISLASDQNLFTLMRKTIREDGKALEYEDYQDLGVLITQIGDKVSGTDNNYWQYWVNNHFAQIAASSYVVEEGDVIEWKFTKQQLYESR